MRNWLPTLGLCVWSLGAHAAASRTPPLNINLHPSVLSTLTSAISTAKPGVQAAWALREALHLVGPEHKEAAREAAAFMAYAQVHPAAARGVLSAYADANAATLERALKQADENDQSARSILRPMIAGSRQFAALRSFDLKTFQAYADRLFDGKKSAPVPLDEPNSTGHWVRLPPQLWRDSANSLMRKRVLPSRPAADPTPPRNVIAESYDKTGDALPRQDVVTPVSRLLAPRVETLRRKILGLPDAILVRAFTGSSNGPRSHSDKTNIQWAVLPVHPMDMNRVIDALRFGDLHDAHVSGLLRLFPRYLAGRTGEIWVTSLHELVQHNPVAKIHMDVLGDVETHFTEIDHPLNGVHAFFFRMKDGISMDFQRLVRADEKHLVVPPDVNFFSWDIEGKIDGLLGRALKAAPISATKELKMRMLLTPDFRGLDSLSFIDVDEPPLYRELHRCVEFYLQVEPDGHWTIHDIRGIDTRMNKHLIVRQGKAWITQNKVRTLE